MATMKVKPTAMFLDMSDHVEFKFAASNDGEGDDRITDFTMIGYSGGTIPDHWYWGNLAIDLAGMKFPKKKFPILRDHDTNREVGFSTKPTIDPEKGMVFTLDHVTFLDNEEADSIIKNSKEGFPYQASIFAKPTKIEKVNEGESIEVNGKKLIGPGHVWRQSVFKECSICVFGYDSNTSATAFEDAPLEVEVEVFAGETENHSKENVMPVTLAQFKAENPDEYTKFVEDLKAEAASQVEKAEAKFTAQVADLEKKLAESTADNEKLSQENTSFEKRVLTLEKAHAVAQEKAIANEATAMFSKKLADSNIPDRLHGKIMKMVGHSQFVTDGVLDTEKFGAAIDKELEDWAFSATDPQVQGIGSFNRDVESGSKMSETPDETADRMLGYLSAHKKGE